MPVNRHVIHSYKISIMRYFQLVESVDCAVLTESLYEADISCLKRVNNL